MEWLIYVLIVLFVYLLWPTREGMEMMELETKVNETEEKVDDLQDRVDNLESWIKTQQSEEENKAKEKEESQFNDAKNTQSETNANVTSLNEATGK